MALIIGGREMAYYLKKTKQKNGRTYLSICESYYHPEKKQTAQKLYASYGSVETLKDKGIEDPVSYYQAEVDRLNSERKKTKAASKEKQIGIVNICAVFKPTKLCSFS